MRFYCGPVRRLVKAFAGAGDDFVAAASEGRVDVDWHRGAAGGIDSAAIQRMPRKGTEGSVSLANITIGPPMTSAQLGDYRRAYLVAIEACANYEDSLKALKGQRKRLMIYCALNCLALTVAVIWGWVR